MIAASWTLSLNHSALVEVVFILLWWSNWSRWRWFLSLHELLLFFDFLAFDEFILRLSPFFTDNNRRWIATLFTNNDRLWRRRPRLANDDRLW
jgi:hypothetical protein